MTETLVPPVDSTDPIERWSWEPQPAAQSVLQELVHEFLGHTPFARELARRMIEESGTRFIDWIDFIEFPATESMLRRIAAAGWRPTPYPGATHCHSNPLGVFPRLLPTPAGSQHGATKLGIKVDCVIAFMRSHGIQGFDRVIGAAHEQLRMVKAASGHGTELWAIERHGYRGFQPVPMSPSLLRATLHHQEVFETRRRDFADDREGLAHTESLVSAAVADLGAPLACDRFFEAERRYWMSRNHAAVVQKARQDRLGLGWANHDHHTYRCSRPNFRQHIRILETLGLQCRERFYAGSEAGWGAQVMEDPITGIITFNDVDMSPSELMTDFAHHVFDEPDHLGTVGLWCALHGDSMLEAGMHHLEAMFDHESLRAQLEADHGVRTMAPFTTFPYLRQAFTEGERWTVKAWRVERLVERGLITEAQGESFLNYGAIGSHLENLERNDGFKGFNQTGVSDIIHRTDPRRANASHGRDAATAGSH
ncbi:MAG: hypothetical protein U0572_18095 [Phycisphaerales bacterium]